MRNFWLKNPVQPGNVIIAQSLREFPPSQNPTISLGFENTNRLLVPTPLSAPPAHCCCQFGIAKALHGHSKARLIRSNLFARETFELFRSWNCLRLVPGGLGVGGGDCRKRLQVKHVRAKLTTWYIYIRERDTAFYLMCRRPAAARILMMSWWNRKPLPPPHPHRHATNYFRPQLQDRLIIWLSWGNFHVGNHSLVITAAAREREREYDVAERLENCWDFWNQS